MARRPSVQTAAVVTALLDAEQDWSYGYELSKKLAMPSGTLYPILMRLSERGQLETRWSEPATKGRPPRHMYRLTEAGSLWAVNVVVASSTASPRVVPRVVGEPG